jgi:hypothetical protein
MHRGAFKEASKLSTAKIKSAYVARRSIHQCCCSSLVTYPEQTLKLNTVEIQNSTVPVSGQQKRSLSVLLEKAAHIQGF